MRTVKLTDSGVLFVEARMQDLLNSAEASQSVKKLAHDVIQALEKSEPDTTEQRGPDRKPTIVVEPGALNHIRCMDLIDFMIPQGLEMVQDGARLVIRRKRGNAGKVRGNAGEFPAFNIGNGGGGGNPPADPEGGSGGRADLQSRLDETYSTKQVADEAWEKAKAEVEEELSVTYGSVNVAGEQAKDETDKGSE